MMTSSMMAGDNSVQVTLDIGNTRSKVAIFEGRKLLEKHTLKENVFKHLSNIAKRYPLATAIVCDTGLLDDAFAKFLAEKFEYIVFNHQTPIPIKNHYKTPSTLGKDRIAAAIGGSVLFPNKNLLIIDAGTCITYEILSADGTYLGGNISPGLDMRLKAMHHFTDKLPLPSKQRLQVNWGYSTESALLIGALEGAIHEINGFIDQYSSLLGEIKTIITGGDAIFFDNNFKTKIFAEPNLVHIGLNEILLYQKKN